MTRARQQRIHVSPGATDRTFDRTYDDFGVLRVRAGGDIITELRGVPVQVRSWGSVDPGGHDAATIDFPQIPLSDLGQLMAGTGDLSWYHDGVAVHIDHLIDATVKTVYRGRVRAVNVVGDRVSLECDGDLIGPYSWATYRPLIDRVVEDVGRSIVRQNPSGSQVTFADDNPITGIEMERTGSRSDSRWGYVTNSLAMAQTRNGVQWTVLPTADDPGVYEVVQRDLTTHDLTVHLGYPGVDASLLHDITSRPTRYFGEGQRSDGGRWYGAVFPYLNLTTPTFPGTIGLGDTGEDVMVLFRTLGRFGLSYDDARGYFSSKMADAVENVQEEAGLPVTGIVNEATWNVIFDPATVGSLYGASYEPLVQRDKVRKLDRAPSGLVIGLNDNYDEAVPLVDSFTGFGVGVEKSHAREWSRTQMQQDFAQPEWTGTITLTTDPAQMSRFEVRAGMNLYDPTFGGGTVFHIASVGVDWQSGSVSCDVSTRGRDYLDIASIKERNAAARQHPSRRFAAQLSRRSALSQDMRAGWDYEGGAGIFAETDCPGGEWTVVPVFVGESGTIGELHFRTRDPQTEFCVAIFAREVGAIRLNGWAVDPLAERAEDGSWVTDVDNVDELHGVGAAADANQTAQLSISGRVTDGRLLVYAAGTGTTPSDAPMPCGYWPHADAGKADNNSLGANLTGVWKDDSSFDYWTYEHPFLYVAVWPRSTTTMKGRLYPSMVDGGM